MINDLVRSLTRFRKEYFLRYEDHYRKLVAEGQRPHTLFIGCADSRLVPQVFMDLKPGELFVVRNVGNLIPPYESTEGYHGVSAAIEYAVGILNVRDIVVCGHSHCGAIHALYSPPAYKSHHVEHWLELARPAVINAPPTDDVLQQTEQRSILLQLDHLMTFPVVAERVQSGALALHGWYYVIEEGVVHTFDPSTEAFVPFA
jgi:carbonic anhydrase